MLKSTPFLTLTATKVAVNKNKIKLNIMEISTIKKAQTWLKSFYNEKTNAHAIINIEYDKLSLHVYKDSYNLEKSLKANSIDELKDRLEFELKMKAKYKSKDPS